jgi:hypothetical protein
LDSFTYPRPYRVDRFVAFGMADFVCLELLFTVLLLALFVGVFRVGRPLRLVEAIFSSSVSLMELTMLFEAPFKPPFGVSPRFAASAAPAAICCFFDLAGIQFVTRGGNQVVRSEGLILR